MPATSAACVSLAEVSSAPRMATSWKSNSRSSPPERKRQTGRMSISITKALSPTPQPVGPSRARLVVREEELLAVDPVGGDRGLPRGRDHPVDELLSHVLLHVRVPGWIHQHRAVLVEELDVALDQDHEVGAVPEREPAAAVGERVGVHAGGG